MGNFLSIRNGPSFYTYQWNLRFQFRRFTDDMINIILSTVIVQLFLNLKESKIQIFSKIILGKKLGITEGESQGAWHWSVPMALPNCTWPVGNMVDSALESVSCIPLCI